jgi:hypothetical protein
MTNHLDLLKQECYESQIENVFPDTLELLERFRSHKIHHDRFLDNVSILFIQHILQPFIGRLKVMETDGMNPDNTWFVDIPYSTNDQVLKKVNEFSNHKIPTPYTNPLEDYTKSQLNRVKTTIKEIIKSRPGKLLVIDDGAYFIRAIHELYIHNPDIISSLVNKTYIIEQTTRGHRYLTEDRYGSIIKELNSPIVSVARCKTKIEIESPFIGIACKRSLEANESILALINKHQNAFSTPLKVAVIGYGAIGQAVFESIKGLIDNPSEIDVVEIDIDKWNQIRKDNGNPIAELREQEYDLLLGCTGYKSFGWKDRNKVANNGLLVSVSSASVEFSRSNYIEIAELYPDDPIEIFPVEPDKGIHTDLLFKDGSKQFYFVNSGFPVNFTGKRECMPQKFIQPTHTLLYAASYQVLNNPIPGPRNICDEYDYWIYFNSFSAV